MATILTTLDGTKLNFSRGPRTDGSSTKWSINDAPASGSGFLALAGSVVLALAIGAVWLFDSVTGSAPYSVSAAAPRSRAEILEACDVHVRAAEVEARSAVDQRAAGFAAFIEYRQTGVAAFSREMVSWRSKWRVIKQYLPFTDTDGHRKYVEEQFAKNIFSEAEIADATRLAVTGSLKDLEAIENRLAVQVRAEINGSSVGAIEVSAAEKQFAAAIDSVVSASQWDAAKTVGNLAVAEVAATVGTQVLARLGVSAGILGTGAANSWWTLGGGLLLGLAVDAVWQWIDDPAGDIERETVAALESLANEGTTALRSELGAVVTTRVRLWNQAVQEMVP
jgi:hypothetical protein